MSYHYPKHKHNCDRCIFVGVDQPSKGEPPTSQVDMYVHELPTRRDLSGLLTLIRRYSDEPYDYIAYTYWPGDNPPRLPPLFKPVLDAWEDLE